MIIYVIYVITLLRSLFDSLTETLSSDRFCAYITYIIQQLCVIINNNVRSLGVYHDH